VEQAAHLFYLLYGWVANAARY